MFNTNLSVAVIGAGGTSSWLIKPLYSLLVELAGKNTSLFHNLVLIDNDIVEEKNTYRQAFHFKDIGNNKADTLISRLNHQIDDVPNLRVSSIPLFILDDLNREEYLEKFLRFSHLDFAPLVQPSTGDTLTVIVGLSDNNKTRRIVIEEMKNANYPYVIVNAGNEDKYGQVTVEGNIFPTFRSFYDLHPEHQEANDGVNAGPSCADFDEEARNQGPEQTISANILSANLTMDLLHKIFNNQSLVVNERSFMMQDGIVCYN